MADGWLIPFDPEFIDDLLKNPVITGDVEERVAKEFQERTGRDPYDKKWDTEGTRR